MSSAQRDARHSRVGGPQFAFLTAATARGGLESMTML
jgi:hypothetical protein